jgi:hypothetical protein
MPSGSINGQPLIYPPSGSSFFGNIGGNALYQGGTPQQKTLGELTPQSILEMLSQMIPNYGALNNRGASPASTSGGWSGGRWNGNGLWGGTGMPAATKPASGAGVAPTPTVPTTPPPSDPYQDSVNVYGMSPADYTP